MKPAVCCICGKSALEEKSNKKGDWVEFEDYDPDKYSLSHPIGLEYFCSEHIVHAIPLKHKKSEEALIELKKSFPPVISDK